MTALVGEKRKKPGGKIFKEPPVIPCTVEELNQVLDKWIGDGVVRPFTMSRPPTEEERKFCRIHNYVKHSTKDCWTLRRLFHKKLREGILELTQKEPEVQRNPLPNHKGKWVVAVVIHGNPAEAKEPEGSKKGGHRVPHEHSSRFRNGMFHSKVARQSSLFGDNYAINFTDEDMEVEHPDHRRPLYLMATINGVQVRRALVDTGASLNLIALSTLEAVGLTGRRILEAPMEITGFGGSAKSTERYVQLALRVGPIVALTRFHVINSEVSYHVLLGRPWLHKHRLIPFTYHQCVKGRLNGKPVRIPANPNPFSQGEVNFVETMFYDELELDDESPTLGTPGAPILEEEEGASTHDLRDLLERKRQKREPSSSGSRKCAVVKEPGGRVIYRL
ncbi:uncharacterized protein LOC142605980 [Castanea sativa]|uniref:uncharacterized protein LOC142605980 n=1 Tax=Castanea sativa TaxID=21020 RepID=UPI003F64C804